MQTNFLLNFQVITDCKERKTILSFVYFKQCSIVEKKFKIALRYAALFKDMCIYLALSFLYYFHTTFLSFGSFTKHGLGFYIICKKTCLDLLLSCI